MVKVWSERRTGAWDQCTECAYLMTLVHGGFRPFPAGIYTDAERDALDAATPPDPPSGGSTFSLLDIGAIRRYGLCLHRIPDGSKAGLRRMLNVEGQALAIAGSLGNLPNGHRLRRWQPDYTGGHAICVIAEGDGKVLWLDPLAPMGFEGDHPTVDNVLTFAWYPSDARVVPKLGLAGVRLARRAARTANALAETLEAVRDFAADLTDNGG